MPVASADEFFSQRLPKRLSEKPDVVEKINATYKFVLTGGGGGTWTVDLTTPGGKITAADLEASCVITIAAGDFVDIVNGISNAQMAFMSGKLRVAGDIGQALKLQYILA
jgi:putative sterol carrier protein